MGVTTVLPEMDFSRPTSADPVKLVKAANDWQVTQAFASPAVWRIVARHCKSNGSRIPSLRQVFSCGAPVSAKVLRSTLACVADGAQMHTPYGATECLPVSSIEGAEVLGETATRTDQGAGVCVGRNFNSIEWRVIRISDGPIDTIQKSEELPIGEIGEIIVRGPQVSPKYVTRVDANPISKIRDESLLSPSHLHVWHRTGDVGYFDAQDRFWYCGRKSQRVVTAEGTLYTECVEAVVNNEPDVHRSALVGIGPRGKQVPVIVAERSNKRIIEGNPPILDRIQSKTATRQIQAVLFRSHLPVDIRHNAKINREQLTIWAAQQLPELG
jgi:acyl-CoA synthetase (AMP-forming)/AMP-acid ligase II